MNHATIRFPEYLGSRRHQYCNIGPVAAVPLGSFPVSSPLSFEDSFILEVKECIDAIGALYIHTAAIPAVSSAGTAFGNLLFSPKSDTTVTARSGNHMYFRTIY